MPEPKLLIANRGEIAVRIARACRDVGVRTVLAHSTVDADSLAASLVDETICIGPSAANQSYLLGQAIVSAAIATGSTHVHPGYGFLSENADFAALCETHELQFVGPTSESIRTLADKLEARSLAISASVPVVPGTEVHPGSDSLISTAEEIGLPLLVKAAGGGGGRGMRLVTAIDDVAASVEAAASEAEKVFADPSVYLERYVPRARHVEVQLLGDGRGNVLEIGDRDCSMQRRHQKVIEEAPAPNLPEGVRRAMADAAVRLAEHLSYRSAGTVEFIYDPAASEYFFLEMNTRIQVEHPVSEEVFGIDLVAEQIRLALEPTRALPAAQTARGHSIECRLTAEDPRRGFLPRAGEITEVRWPTGPGVRVDTGFTGPYAVPPFYDSMLAKIVCSGRDRTEAIQRMKRALSETHIEGISTNLDLLAHAIESTEFVEVAHYTSWIEDAGLKQFLEGEGQ